MLPILETDRCILRAVSIEDCNDMFEYASDDKVVKYLTFPKHTNIENTKEIINNFFIDRYEKGISYDYGIFYKEDCKFIGTAGFNSIKDGIATLGYCMNSNYWNKGIMTEVVNEIFRFGFNNLNINKIEAIYYDGNNKSGNVMTKCNMKYVGNEEKEIRLQGNMVHGKIHKCELTRDDYFKKVTL